MEHLNLWYHTKAPDIHLHSFSNSFGIHHRYTILKRSLNAELVSVHYFIYTADINDQFKLENVSQGNACTRQEARPD